MSRSAISLGVVFAVAVGAAPARADQCEVVDADAGAWALKLVKRGMAVAQFCETCGDKTPGASTVVSTIATTKDKAGTRVSINNKKVDLAYTYVQTGKTTWSNVGLLVGCAANGVTPIVAITAEKPAPPISQAPTGIAECDAYIGAVGKLMSCQAFPKESRDAMKQGVDQMRPAIEAAKSTPDGRKALVEACRQAADAIRQAATSLKCAI